MTQNIWLSCLNKHYLFTRALNACKSFFSGTIRTEHVVSLHHTQADPDLCPTLLSSTYFLLGRHLHAHYFTPLDFCPLFLCNRHHPLSTIHENSALAQVDTS